MEITNPWFIC